MADPFRLRVLKALCDTLKTIHPSRGYVNDMTDYVDETGRMRTRVFRGVSQFGMNDPLPMISLLEDPSSLPQNLGGNGGDVTAGDWRIVIQGFVQDDPEHPTDPAHILAAEVIRALAIERYGKREYGGRNGNLLGLGGRAPCVREILYENPVVRPADDHVSSVAYFYMVVVLALAEIPSDPFA